MKTDQHDFQSLRNIRDTTLLLSIANEYISEDVFLSKIGSEIKKNLSVLRDDIASLKRKFPGKFTHEVNTDNILTGFEMIAQDMLSGGDEIIEHSTSGRLGMALSAQVDRITEAIERIWFQVKGSDVKYTASDSINVLLGRLNILSHLTGLFSGFIRILLFVFILSLAGFGYLYFTMEREGQILRENTEIMISIEEKKSLLNELEKKKADAQKRLKVHETDNLLRKDKIAIIDIETKIQEINQEVHLIEGQLEAYRRTMENNNEKLEKVKEKSFLDRLLKQ